MKVIRSTQITLKFATDAKRGRLDIIMGEYSRVVNFFIERFKDIALRKAELLKPIVDMPETWLSFSMRQTAAREAIDMLHAHKEAESPGIPRHNGKIMRLSTGQVSFQGKRSSSMFDSWLHIKNIGGGVIFDIPVKLHRHYHSLAERGRMMGSFVVRQGSVQLSFEIETGPKMDEGEPIGIDTGIKSLATTSNGDSFGNGIEQLIEKVKRKKHGSVKQARARRELRHYMDATAKDLLLTTKPRLIVMEGLKRINHKTKLTRRVSKNMRRSLGSWNYRYWLGRMQMSADDNRVAVRTVNPAYTSQRCHECGHIERGNRKTQEKFLCMACGYACNADINAARNILERFLSGPYGAACKVSPGVHCAS